jgi:hypothetical protein
MEKKGQPKIEVKMSAKIAISLWTMGAMYTAGQLTIYPWEEFFAKPWYAQIAVGLILYALWPFFLGMIHAG